MEQIAIKAYRMALAEIYEEGLAAYSRCVVEGLEFHFTNLPLIRQYQTILKELHGRVANVGNRGS